MPQSGEQPINAVLLSPQTGSDVKAGSAIAGACVGGIWSRNLEASEVRGTDSPPALFHNVHNKLHSLERFMQGFPSNLTHSRDIPEVNVTAVPSPTSMQWNSPQVGLQSGFFNERTAPARPFTSTPATRYNDVRAGGGADQKEGGSDEGATFAQLKLQLDSMHEFIERFPRNTSYNFDQSQRQVSTDDVRRLLQGKPSNLTSQSHQNGGSDVTGAHSRTERRDWSREGVPSLRVRMEAPPQSELSVDASQKSGGGVTFCATSPSGEVSRLTVETPRCSRDRNSKTLERKRSKSHSPEVSNSIDVKKKLFIS